MVVSDDEQIGKWMLTQQRKILFYFFFFLLFVRSRNSLQVRQRKLTANDI